MRGWPWGNLVVCREAEQEEVQPETETFMSPCTLLPFTTLPVCSYVGGARGWRQKSPNLKLWSASSWSHTSQPSISRQDPPFPSFLQSKTRARVNEVPEP